MQMSSTLPVHNLNLFQTRSTTTASFNCRGFGSPLNPSTRSVPSLNVKAVATIESTRKHLSNLKKILQKQSQPDPPDLSPVVENVGGEGTPENRGKGLLEGLNLAQIWPEVKPEEMSPGRMSSLRRLLSMSQEYSPRNNLASRWREYHGSGDWEGLLDPLDENLRREVVRYGEFVQAAYRCFHSNPSTSTNEPPSSHRHVALSDRSYRVTKSLYATSSIGLPKWVDDVAPDLEWMTQRTSWVGYVAVCEDQREIARMGRRDIVIALRGTATCIEWAENFRDILVQIPGQNDPTHGQPKVECGFLSLHKTRGAQVPSLAESVVQEIQRLMALYEGETLSITVTGHSLGAALALLVADELSTCAPEVPPVAVFSFGGPRVGNRGFANRIHSKNVKVLRIVNSQDVITRVPGMFVSEDLDRTLRNSSAAGVLDMLDNTMPWAYWHVGTELRVDTKMSPFLKPNADVACCHDLEAYLHLVDGFLSSNCPFRANAKRSLVKLLNEQKPNVKKLYTSKAKALRLNIDREGLPMSSCLPSPS
ncbi:phospholipase A1-Ibeta2, chloroplastic-like [Actinidia eriantha]|uniref:phospholipase A1-Ibeta2, chloroplastic-like n=1 Tax=Actinidia eriantha TaxID=165200 RepID=UPI00258CC1AD|nr:phospholipase A1-Ibeta2, chloroplastic-like [Actinidia eriantha]